MGSIFDENSEFLDYLNKKKMSQDKSSTEDESDLYFKATPLVDASEDNPRAGFDLESETPSSKLFDPNQAREEHTELHIQDTAPKEVYTLNLKNHQIKSPLQTLETKSSHQKLDLKQAKSPAESLDSSAESQASVQPSIQASDSKKFKKLDRLQKSPDNLQSFLLDKLNFLATTFAIFLVFFFALNWSAYSQILMNKYQDFTGQTQESPLQTFTTDTTDTSQITSSNSVTTEVSNSPFAVNHFSIPAIALDVVPPGTRIIIPRINKNVPVINVSDDKLIAKDWAALESDIQDSLKDGVVHYPGTPWPDQSGNVVLTGHSSYYPWDPGRFKDVFALLHNVELDDEIVIFYKQKKYSYTVSEIEVVLPTEVNVLGDNGDDRLTLITCTPVGTNLKRLIVTAKPS